MLRAIAIKELRGIGGIAAVALAVSLCLVPVQSGVGFLFFARMQRMNNGIPFVNDSFLFLFSLVAIALAISLGWKQSVWESFTSTYPFLLHRPVNRQQMMMTKLATGASLFWVVMAAPVLLHAWRAATPGLYASPFYWSMTANVWYVWLSLIVLYLGSFLSGIRPGRWFGTRLLPLVSAGSFVLLLQGVPWRSLLGPPAIGLVCAAFVAVILVVARDRDYS